MYLHQAGPSSTDTKSSPTAAIKTLHLNRTATQLTAQLAFCLNMLTQEKLRQYRAIPRTHEHALRPVCHVRLWAR